MASILIVDDSASMRNMVKATLSTAGHEVFSADDGRQGVEAANQAHYDVVVTDLNMPIMDGFELIRSLRESENYRYTPILLLTTESSQEKKQEGKAAGATGWLVKPFNPEKLLVTIDRVLN